MREFLFAAAAFGAGMLVSFGNYLISKKLLGSGNTAVAATARSIISAAFLIMVFFIGAKTSLPAVPMLVGGALGLTAGLILFTYMLIKNHGGKGSGDK